MTTNNRVAFVATVLAAAALACPPAWADRGYGHEGHGYGHGNGGWGWGLGLLLGTAILIDATQPRPVYYPLPTYVAPPVYVQPPIVMAAPPSYTSLPPQAQPAEQSWWYYCNSSAAYYPYVRNCPEGWVRVSPQPPGQ